MKAWPFIGIVAFFLAGCGSISPTPVGKHSVSDLRALEPKISVGMTEPEVLAVAGKPDDTYSEKNVQLLHYNASMTEMLIVSLKDGRVVKVKLFAR